MLETEKQITPAYLNEEQAAQYLGITHRAFRKLMKVKECKHYSVPNEHNSLGEWKSRLIELYQREDLDYWMKLFRKV